MAEPTVNERLDELYDLNMQKHTRENEMVIGNHIIAIRKQVKEQQEFIDALIYDYKDAVIKFAADELRTAIGCCKEKECGDRIALKAGNYNQDAYELCQHCLIKYLKAGAE